MQIRLKSPTEAQTKNQLLATLTEKLKENVPVAFIYEVSTFTLSFNSSPPSVGNNG